MTSALRSLPGSVAVAAILSFTIISPSWASPPPAQKPCAPELLETAGEDFTALDSRGSTLVAYDTNAGRIVPFEWTNGAWARGTPSATVFPALANGRAFLSMTDDVVAAVLGVDYGYHLAVLERSSASWTVTYTNATFATPGVATASDRHEVAISPSGEFIAVGFPGDNYGAGNVDLYQRAGSAVFWHFFAPIHSNNSFNGFSVAMTDGLLATTQPASTGLTGSPFRGSIALFTLPAGFSTPTFNAFISPPTDYDVFGLQVVLDGDWLVALSRDQGGLPRLDRYHFGPFGWDHQGPVPLPASHSGQPIVDMDLRGTRLLVAAAGSGGLHEFELSVDSATLLASSSHVGLGEPVHRSDYGREIHTAAGLLAEPDETLIVSYCGCSAGGPCGTPANSGAGCLNAAGTHAQLRACGSTRVAFDDLLLTIDGLTPNTWLIPFMGRARSGVAAENGVVCIGSPAYRYAPVPASGSTASVRSLVAQSRTLHPTAAQLAAGQTWSFQAWYRDAGGPCGAASNFTNALTITFEP